MEFAIRICITKKLFDGLAVVRKDEEKKCSTPDCMPNEKLSKKKETEKKKLSGQMTIVKYYNE